MLALANGESTATRVNEIVFGERQGVERMRVINAVDVTAPNGQHEGRVKHARDLGNADRALRVRN